MLEESLDLIIKNHEKAALARGVALGEARGETKGRIETLLELLTWRFGELPAATVETIRNASLAQLQVWSIRLMQASTLDQVFETKGY